jgi:hypothetical protein
MKLYMCLQRLCECRSSSIISVGKPEWKRTFWRRTYARKGSIKTDPENRLMVCLVVSSTGDGPITRFCEYDNEWSHSIRVEDRPSFSPYVSTTSFHVCSNNYPFDILRPEGTYCSLITLSLEEGSVVTNNETVSITWTCSVVPCGLFS